MDDTMPTSAESDEVTLARLSKTPAEAYERGFIDGHAKGVEDERARWAKALAGMYARAIIESPEALSMLAAIQDTVLAGFASFTPGRALLR